MDNTEKEQFVNSTVGAVDAYLQTDEKAKRYVPNVWLLDSRAADYAFWTHVIRERREKKVRYERAEIEHSQFLKEIDGAVKKFKEELTGNKKPGFAYPPTLAKYEPLDWAELELPSGDEVQRWAAPYILKRVPLVLRSFVSWELDWQFQTLPYAKYEVTGVPCLAWCFRVLVLVEVHLRLMEERFVKEFHGYEYQIKVESQELGYFYLGPVEWYDRKGFSIPLALLSLLAKGEMEGPSIEVIDRDAPYTVFDVQGFTEEIVVVYDDFRKFIEDVAKEKPLAQALLDVGVMDADTASLVKLKWDQPLPVSNKVSDAGGSDLESVVAKLVELGWTDADAKKAVGNTIFPYGATIEDKVKIILAKSYVNSA